MRRLQTLLLCTIGVFGLATVYVSGVMFERQKALEQASHYNVSFSASQAVNEYLRFDKALALYHSGLGQVTADDVVLRYEILLNRLQLLTHGEFLEFLDEEPDRRKIINDLERILTAIEPMIDRLDQLDVVGRIVERIGELEGPLIGIASEANHYGGERAAEVQNNVLRLHWLFSGLTFCLVIAGVTLILLLSWSNRLLARTHKELHKTAGDLELRTEKLRRQNSLFDAALNNMSQGLCMVGPNGEMIVSNRRFREMYRLPEDLSHADATISGVIEYCSGAGMSDRDTLERMFAQHDEGDGDAARSAMLVEELDDGRIISVNNQPLEDGGWLTTHEDVTERRRAEAKIAYIARHDTLTGLPNRAQFCERMAFELERLRTKDEKFAVLCFDIDRFKNVNDTLGHRYGDLLLQSIARRAQALVRDFDMVSRFGGDEFAMVLAGVAEEDEAGRFAQRLIDHLCESYDLEGHRVIVGVSVGVAVVEDYTLDPEFIIKNADTALYRAKSTGGSVYRYFDAGMDTRLQARRTLELELWNAFERSEFQIFYQPIMDIAEGSVVGVEALLRWEHPERGFVPPDEFVPVAEDIGLIEPLGEWVLLTACAEIARLPHPVRLAVNLSPIQFSRGDLVKTVAKALAATGLPANRLELEITESILVHENTVTHSVLSDLRSMDITFALDDFGTGYSSLSYIRKFPIDKIKIDKSFVSDVTHNVESLAIVRAVTTLADSLGLTTTAEGIETQEQLKLLHLAGCVYGQGYLFSRPRPLEEITALMKKTPAELKLVARSAG